MRVLQLLVALAPIAHALIGPVAGSNYMGPAWKTAAVLDSNAVPVAGSGGQKGHMVVSKNNNTIYVASSGTNTVNIYTWNWNVHDAAYPWSALSRQQRTGVAVTTIGRNGTAGYGGDNEVARNNSNVRFSRPSYLALNAANDLFILGEW